MPDDPVLLSRNGHVATITLNRPAAMNALSAEVMMALEAVVNGLRIDEAIRAVIITGAGKAFCAGGDLLQFGKELQHDPQSLISTLKYNQSVLQSLASLPVPVIAAVNGVAVAGGLEIILSCDVAISAENAKIGDGHAKYAIVPAGGSTVRLLMRMPAVYAMNFLFSAELFSAKQCLEWGLVNDVVPAEQLQNVAMELAQQYCRQSPDALRHIKSLTRKLRDDVVRTGMHAELMAFESHLTSSDLAKGLKAFQEKRLPEF